MRPEKFLQKKKKGKKALFSSMAVFLASLIIFGLIAPSILRAEDADDPDYDAYRNYELYLKYEKKAKYAKYKKYKKYKKKYGFDSSAEKAKAKSGYEKYKLCKKNSLSNCQIYYEDYKDYSKYKKYCSPYKKYSRYGKYEKYDKSSYDAGKNFKNQKEGHDRYLASRQNGGLGEADLGGGALGPEISVGIYSYAKSDLRDSDDDYIRVRASKDYVVKNETGETLVTVPANIEAADGDIGVRVRYLSGGDLKVYQTVPETNAGSDVYFEAADGDSSDMIFDLNRSGSNFDQYRGKIKVHFYDSSESDGDRVWVINTLPLEHYVWGIGEITGTGDSGYNKTMTVMFRTYGYWKVKFSTAYAAQGFKVVATSSNQIYNGYDWEKTHPRIREAAESTAGKLMMHGSEVALSPYSSWTDGRTRSFEERWGSDDYPWCRSVSDPYGKHATLSTAELENAGNHMVGLSAHGALNLASDYDWDWEEILEYYFHKVRFKKVY